MKKVFFVFAATSLALASCVNNPDGKKAETTEAVEVVSTEGSELAVNTDSSSVVWLGKKVTGQHTGTVKIKSGTILITDGQLTGGNFVIDLTTIDNQDQKGDMKNQLETHLKSADFFDVANHPEAKLEITEVKPDSVAGQANISANLTIRGVSKNITFPARITSLSDSVLTAEADFNIAREDWGVNYPGKANDLISKEINFKIKLVAGK